ncbi:MAG: hypothetical protein U1F76_20410 [Candidatus Competibacteraceae bacterium]
MNDRESILSFFGIPSAFGVVLLCISLVLTLAPYLPGHDFGPVKIPSFSPKDCGRLKIIGPILLAFIISLHVPFISIIPSFSSGTTPEIGRIPNPNNLYRNGEDRSGQIPKPISGDECKKYLQRSKELFSQNNYDGAQAWLKGAKEHCSDKEIDAFNSGQQ